MPARNAKSAASRRSDVSDIKLSGYELIRRRKPRGKLATIRDYAKIKWRPWKPDEMLFSDERMRDLEVAARMAYGIMLMTREKTINMYKKLDHDLVDHMMADLTSAAEQLKGIAAMIEVAYLRVLAAGSAYALAGGKVVIDKKEGSRAADDGGAA